MRRWILRVGLGVAMLLPVLLVAQVPSPPPGPGAGVPPLRIFLDCPTYRCDPDFFRAEFAYADFVRSPEDAEVHVLVSEVRTGSGGEEFTLTMLGRRQYDGRADTLRVYTRPDATEDDTRRAIAGRLGLALGRYVADRPGAERFALKFTAPAADRAAVTQARRDPWNYWTYRVSVNSFLNGEQSYKSGSYYGNVSASRVTEALKIQFNGYGNYNRNEYAIDDTTSIVNEQRSYGTSLLVAPSLGHHWSWATRVSASQSSYQNQDAALKGAAGLEYDFWPYEQVTRRLLTLRWLLEVDHFRYHETTLYGKDTETRPASTLELDVSATQPWGSLGASLESAAYLDDLSKHHVELNGNMDIRLVRGLSLSIYGDIASVHDQIYLSAAGATPQEILLRQHQLATNYTYFTSIGLSYTFGSVFNNVVNPRFR